MQARIIAATSHKRCSTKGCDNCEYWEWKYNKIHSESESTIRNLKKEIGGLHQECVELKNVCKDLQDQLEGRKIPEVNVGVVESEYCPVDELLVENFENYTEEMLDKYPEAEQVMGNFFSRTFRRKQASSSTLTEWQQSASIYVAFILDMFLKSKNSKAVLRTGLLIGVYLFNNNVTSAVWKLLQRLRVVPSRDVVERYLKAIPLPTLEPANFKFFSIDNCDILLKTNSVFADTHNNMLHLVSRIVFDIPRQIAVTLDNLFLPYNVEEGKKFAKFLLPDYSRYCEIANQAVDLVEKAASIGGFKFALREAVSRLNSAKMTILSPLVQVGTTSYEDVEKVIKSILQEFSNALGIPFSLFNGDEQVFTRLWHLRLKFPELYSWVIPFPGEWHWNWQTLRGIFKIYGHYLLLPFSHRLGYKKLDCKGDNFHHSEHFLEVVTKALCTVFQHYQNKHPDLDPVQVMHHYKPNKHLYELLYFFVWYLCPYWETRAAIKAGVSAKLNEFWRYWLHLFIAARKTRYAVMSLRFLWLLEYLHPQVVEIINSFRFFSFSDKPNTAIALDHLQEIVCYTPLR